MHLKAVDLADKLATVTEPWSPRLVARCDGRDVTVLKAVGASDWRANPDGDDLFLVLSGEIDIEMRDGAVTLGPGELFVVPAGVEHRPVARGEAHLLRIEPAGAPEAGGPAVGGPAT